MGSDGLFLDIFSCQVAKKIPIIAHDFGKTPKYRYFSKIRQIIAQKETLTEAIGRQISHNMDILLQNVETR
jgi:hypothetical protein